MASTQGQVSFDVSHEETPADAVVAGFAQFGLAGLTAVDFLSNHLDLSERGHVDAHGLPTVTPFEDGEPRHNTRLFGSDASPVTTLVGELIVPPWAAAPLSDAVLEWVDRSDVEEVLVLSGVPIPHGPEEHDAFYVASPDFRTHRLDDSDLRPMKKGFFDGVNGELLERGIETDLRVGVLVTPVHEQTPDVEAAIRLVEATDDLYDLDVDLDPLREFAEDVAQYYAEIQERMDAAAKEEHRRGLSADRMYM